MNFHKAADDAVVGFGRNKYNFKLSIGEIISVNSADYIQIQVADLLVSSVNHAAKKILDDEEDDFSKMLFSSALYEKSTSAAMWPSHNVTFTAIGN
ncbi:hypothetical protein [Olivibacter domesticus]|uniref:Uncharacterized protein n=1 Tax=Olivibacter domesticus TaxID=407022 RepID=A0A1H7KQE6_OLID1|nr:hypothetical protein [Olivibacter domesticus]SEK89009.1 hypothetical protein SAMN05661044_01431 [Olivibacter domesticus]